jgi:hypothetical protein
MVALLGILRPGWTSASRAEILSSWSAYLKAFALPLTLAFAVFVATDGVVATLNYHHYGIFETNEFRAKSFLRAYGALTRIRHNEWHRYVLFPKDARQRAYSVSSAAWELAPSLEGPAGDAWRRVGCASMNVTPCPEVLSGWFAWEFREAVRNAGHYRSAPEAKNFYDTLADQIDSACNDGRLECLPHGVSSLPPFRWEYVGETVKSSEAVAKELFTMGAGKVGSPPSIGPPDGLAMIGDLVGGVSSPDDVVRSVRGYAATIGQTPSLQVIPNDAKCQFSISFVPALDVAAMYPDLSAVRFDMESPDCPITAGSILVEGAGDTRALIPLGEVEPQASVDAPSLRFLVESVSRDRSTKLAVPVQVKIASVIASGYSIAFPILTIFGAVGLLLATLLRKRHPFPIALLAFGWASAVAVCTRIVMLAYIDATYFHAATVLYSSPASPFLIILVVVGIYLGYVTILSTCRRREVTERREILH